MKILVGLSGGVDSASTALMLKQKGHDVEGVIMRIWENNPNAPFKSDKTSCFNPTGENIKEAQKIADSIGINLHIIDCVDEYKNTVIENFKKEYLSGRTPNPCVMCNSLIKFGVLINSAKKRGIEFDKFATGHYARIEKKDGKFLLKKGIDTKKDQTYFLYRLTQDQLSKVIMPLGDFTKDEIRSYAEKMGLIIASKKDSQDFYSGDFNELLDVKDKKGNIIDVDGKILGVHTGIWNYTIGQRKGIKVSAPKPLYVAELKKETNEVVVGYKEDVEKDTLTAANLNWINRPNENKFKATAKIRSAQSEKPCTIEIINDKIKVVFDDMQSSIAKGQSIVIYDNDYVIGGGIIE